MNFQNLESILFFGQRTKEHLAESAGSQDRRVDEIGSGGCSEDDDAVPTFDAVELSEELVNDAIRDAGRIVSATRRQRVELVEKQKARTSSASAVKSLPDGFFRFAHVFREELRTLGGGERRRSSRNQEVGDWEGGEGRRVGIGEAVRIRGFGQRRTMMIMNNAKD